MVRFLTPVPPLMAMSSSPTLILLQAMVPLLAASPGSIPSVLCALDGDSAVPTLFLAAVGVLMVTPQTTKPFAPSLTWNMGELCRVMR
jgi:hypothetical protein